MPANSDMRTTQRALLLAVRERLLLPEADGGAGLLENQCDVELDDQVPAVTGDVYCPIVFNGAARGPAHLSSGGVHDWLLSVKIVVMMRAKNVPRDRKRSVFTDRSDSLASLVDRVYQAVDFRYELTQRADEIILQETGSIEGFNHPLVWRDTTPPMSVPAGVFTASGGDAGLRQILTFTDARRTTTRSY